jgi:hypothetical protein
MQSLTFLTMPVSNPSNMIRQLAPKVPPMIFDRLPQPWGSVLWESNKSELYWRGVPFVDPFLKPLRDSGNDYLLFGMFPMGPLTNPPPPELFEQLKGRTNLVYYDWEITEHRLVHAKQLYQLLNIINRRTGASTNWPTQKWLADIGPHLGNTITEATMTSPKDLSLVRKSHLGLTGFELVTLARWVESAGFPLTFEPPPPQREPPNRNLPRPNTNSPAPKTNPSPQKGSSPASKRL